MRPFIIVFLLLIILTNCGEDDSREGQPNEIITEAQLLFSPSSGGAPVVVSATSESGFGSREVVAAESIVLQAGEEYELFLTFENTLTEEEVITGQSANEHMIFFGFSEGLFASPEGSGNIESRNAQVNYLDKDGNGLPLGLITSWIAAGTAASGEFHILLKHQPNGTKSLDSEATDGETDVSIVWSLIVQ